MASPGSRGRIPSPLTSFVGRSDELTQLERLVEAGRLVTILGPPGTGKSRLAIEHARRRVEAGAVVRHVDLVDARGVEGVCAALSRALDLPALPSVPEAVGASLAEAGELLVVVDAFERLVPCAAETLGAWLEAAPAARFVVT